MATSTFQNAEPVAFFRFCTTRPASPQSTSRAVSVLEDSTDTAAEHLRIFPREQVDIGRQEVEALLCTEAPTISNHHLRVRCVIYEDDNEHDISPLIYLRVLSFNSVELKRPGAGHNTGVAVSRGHGDILLSSGDVLKMTPEIYLQFQYYKSNEPHNALDDFQRAEAKYFANQFFLSGRRLGVGGQASVYIAVKQSNKQQFACKALPLPETDEYTQKDGDEDLRLTASQREVKLLKERRGVAREYAILAKLNHPNIVSLNKVICATYNIYIFQELITGGDLSSYLDQKGPLAEPQAAMITYQLLKAVDYLHANGFVHRDIKPENILMTSWRDGTRVILTDFGYARATDGLNAVKDGAKAFRMQSIVGTYGYTAPEIFRQVKQSLQQKGYSKSVDIWSVGCATAALLTGETLFQQDASDFEYGEKPSGKRTYSKRWDPNIIDKHHSWKSISRRAKNFVKACVAPDEEKRLTAKKALLEEWLTDPRYASELTAAYERAIADWQPRKLEGNLVEFLDTADAISDSPQSSPGKASAVELKSKHFQTAPKSVDLQPPAVKKPAPAFPTKPPPPWHAPMSRDPKDTSKTVPPPSQYSIGSLLFADSIEANNSMLFMPSPNPTANGNTGPLSIFDYGPPQTQFTIHPYPLFRQYDTATQSQLPRIDAAQT